MSDENKVGLQTDPNDIRNIEKLITSVDKLTGSLEHLAGANKGMSDLARMMTTMQATMTTGFRELSIASQKSDDAIVASRKKTANQLIAEEERAWQKLFFTSQAALSKMELAQDASNSKRLASAAAAAEKQLVQEVSAENKRAAALKALMQQRDIWEAEARAKSASAAAAAADRQLNLEITYENRRAAALQASMQKQDLWMAEERGRQYTAAAAQQAKLETLAASSAEKQRLLNSSFVTSPLKSQISTAERAAVYGSMGGNASATFGSAAATADLATLRRQYELLPPATRAAADGIRGHNDIMREGHALARGLSGSLGALWLTYGSLVPLAAGAAIGASLKNIVTVGKEIEYQLKFVEALGNAPVKIDDFLRVTDGTVVSVKEAAEGMRALSQNGLDAVQSLQVLPTILNLAVIGEMSVGAAALAATGAVSAFGLQLGDTARVGDVFAQAAASSNTSVALMAESMKQASTVASVYNVSLEETAGALGQLAKINITGSAAGTAYTNMLTGLYAPTNQAQKALKQLGITTDDGQGGLKNSTVLLGELRVALSQYNDSAKSVYLNDIFTTRGAKAASQLLDNYGELKNRIQEASESTGFMSAAVAKLEDTTEGAFKRMQNSISGSMLKAFTSASPALQALITDFGTLAASDGAVQTLTGLADAALRLTKVIIDHSAAIAGATAIYVAFRVASMAASAATVAATATTTAGFLATNAAAVTRAGGLRLIVASLGWIALAVTAAVVVWQLFVDKATDVEKADQRLRNSMSTNIEFIERETRALEERNKAWNPETQKFDKAPEKQITVEAAEQRVANAQTNLANLAAPASTNMADWYAKRKVLITELKAAEKDLFNQTKAQGELADGLAVESQRKERAAVVTQIEALAKKGETATTVNGKIIALEALGNEKSRAIATEAKALQQQVLAGKLSTKQAQIEILDLEQRYSASLQGKPAKEDKKGAADALRAELERLKLNKELLAVEQQTTVLRNQAANKAGSLGDLGLLDAENKIAKEKAQATIDAAKASIAEVEGIANKRAATVKYQNQLAVGNAQMAQEDIRTGIAKEALFEKMSNDATRFAAKTLSDQGQYVNAFLMEYEATYGPTIKRVETDLTTDISDENRKRLESYLGYLAKMKAAGTNEAVGKSLTQGFDRDMKKLQSDLSDLASQASGQAGLGAIFANAQASAAAYSAQIGEIALKQQQLQSLADANPGNPKLQEQATAELDKMRALTDQMRGMWESVGQSIGDSLTAAFGRGGTALGGLLQATIAYGNKKAQIEEVKDRGDAGDFAAQMKANQVAAQASYSAQLAYYGKLAGAAKGYFKEGSTGYQAMGAVEKATQIAGLAEAARMFIAKSGYLTGLLGIQVASQAEAAAAEGAYTLSSIAMAGARAAASGIAAAVSAMVGWPFPLNMIALAATVAAVGALGVKIMGGGGGGGNMSAAARQQAHGTGSVLGDPSAKSDSIAKSLEAIDKTSSLGLAHTISMDNSLKTLVTNISGLASLLVSGTNLTAPIAKGTQGAQQGIFDKVLGNQSIGEKLSGGLLNKIVGGIFGGAKSVEDVGLQVNSGSLASLMSGAVDVKQYTDIKKKGGLFSSDKYSTNTDSLGSEVNDQFTKIFRSLYDTVVAGANILGLGGDAFAQKLGGFVVDIKEISTKGMTGEEVQTALQTAFSKLGDDMAKFGVDGLQQFQKVGEGYLETLARVANDFLQVNDVLAVLGKSFNVTGLAAVTLSEGLISAAGGLDKLTENTSYFVENFLTEAEKLGPITKSVQAALAPLGASNLTTIEQFKNLVLAQDLSTAAGQQNYAMLTAIAPQFKTMADYLAELSGVIVKSASEIRNERQELQDQYDKLTMSPDQLAAKERSKVDPSNLGLYDQVLALTTAAKNYSDMLEIQAQIYAATGNKAAAATVLEQQHALALQGMSAETAKWTKELWAAQAAVEVTTLQDSLRSAYQSQKTALESVISTSKKFQQSMLDLRDSLQQGDLSTLSPEKKLNAARDQYEDLLARARGGDKDAQGQVGQAAQNFLTADRAYNASNSVYAADAARVQNDLASLAAAAGAEANVAQEQLDALTKQVSSLIKIDDTLTSGFTKVQQAILDLAAALRAGGTPGGANTAGDAVSGVVTGLYKDILGRAPDAGGAKFWTDALNNGTPLTSVVDGFINSPENQGNQIEKLYKDILGRDSDAGGKDFWVKALASGVSISDIKKGFYNSEEYLSKHSHATGGMAFGPSLVGETGPEVVDFTRPAQVYTSSQTAGMFAPKQQPIDPRVVELLDKISRETAAAVVQRSDTAEQDAAMMRAQNLKLDKLARLQRAGNSQKEKT